MTVGPATGIETLPLLMTKFNVMEREDERGGGREEGDDGGGKMVGDGGDRELSSTRSVSFYLIRFFVFFFN